METRKPANVQNASVSPVSKSFVLPKDYVFFFCIVLIVGLFVCCPASAKCPKNGILEAHKFNSLNDALNDIETSSCTLQVSEPLEVDDKVTVPERVELFFTRGGSLVPLPDVEVELKGPIRAPEDQVIFDVENGGTFEMLWTGQIIANWWSGKDIGKRWNNMRESINLTGKRPAPRSFKVVGKHIFSIPFDMTGFRAPGQYTIDFSDSNLIATKKICDDDECDEEILVRPAMDMTNSRGLRIYNLRLSGDTTMVPDVGILLARNSEGNTSGQHIFYGAHISGHWNIATVYNVESEVNHFIGGSYQNDSPNGCYIMYFGRDNIKGVQTPFEDLVLETSSATNQNLSNLRVSGSAVEGGIYLRGFSNVHINEVFLKNGGSGAQITLDNSVDNMTGIEITRFQSEGKQGSGPESALKITGGRTIGNLIYDHVSDGASRYSVNIESGIVRFSDFRVNSSNDFRAGPDTKLEQVRIQMTARNQAQGPQRANQKVILGDTFVGEIYMGNPDSNLEQATGIMEARIHDYFVDDDGSAIAHAKLRLLETGAPTFLIESTDSGGPGTQARLELKNSVSRWPYDWQIYGKGQKDEGQLAIRQMDGEEDIRDVLTIRKNGFVGIGTEIPSYPLEMESGAHVTLGGVWTDASSWQLIENIRDLTIDEAITALDELEPKQFNYTTDNEEECLGFISEDVPDLVATKDRKGLSPMDIVAVLTKVVQTQQRKIEELEAWIEASQ